MGALLDHGALMADRARMGAYEQALRQTIRKGSVVVDLGTGTGILALLACRLGARRVYAIEPDDTIQVAREIAAANGCAERIDFIQAVSTKVTLPELADVIVSHGGGVLPGLQQHIRSVADARRRFLGPRGVLVPKRDVAWATVVQAPALYACQTEPWTANGLGFNMDAAFRVALNSLRRARFTTDSCLSDPRAWAMLDYDAVEGPDVRGEATCLVTRAGVGHGLAAGFDRTLVEGVSISNVPGAPTPMRPDRGRDALFFPWPSPVALEAGDAVAVTFDATLMREDYVWTWTTRVLRRGAPGSEKARFTQSTFFGVPLSPGQLQKRSATYVPTISEDGRIVRFVLELMGESVPLGTIAAHLSTRFSRRFPDPQDAIDYVGDLSRQYG